MPMARTLTAAQTEAIVLVKKIGNGDSEALEKFEKDLQTCAKEDIKSSLGCDWAEDDECPVEHKTDLAIALKYWREARWDVITRGFETLINLSIDKIKKANPTKIADIRLTLEQSNKQIRMTITTHCNKGENCEYTNSPSMVSR